MEKEAGLLPGLVLIGPAYERLVTACARSKIARLKLFWLEFRLQPVFGKILPRRAESVTPAI